LRGLGVALLMAGVVAVPTAARAQDVGLDIGARPEAAQVEDLDGNVVDLGRYIGKRPVVFEFWATWCPLCKALEPRLARAKERFGDRVDFVIIGVGVNQTVRSIKRHIVDHPLPGTVLWDGKGAAVRSMMAPSTSYIIVLDGAGRTVYTGIGADQDIEAAVTKAIAAK
jgi:thiol-disulfide isomerase/thioredoxin